MSQAAADFATRLQDDTGDDPAQQVTRAFRLATSRTPNSREVAKNVDFLNQLHAQDGHTPARALQIFCLMMLNLNEFVYLN